ncbi:hypothetical protein U3A55_11860 [Salarchaeum sp. III]|uniref:hypothetical protein n=1 Tax=Salarchaeum sp. III TaxID=3107927 RepID=UPI002ED94831
MTYLHDHTDDADLSSTGTLLELKTEEATTVTAIVEASVASSFAIDVDLGNGWRTGFRTYDSTDAVADTISVAARRVRIRNTAGQTAGDTATVDLGAA